MKRIARALLLALILFAVAPPFPAAAQDYSFTLDQETVDVYWEADGTATIEYTIVVTNDSFGPPLDAFDFGAPTGSYDLGAVTADLDGRPITGISSSPFVQNGVAVELGAAAIQPGGRGALHVVIPRVRGVIYEGEEEGYASVQFAPSSFDAGFVHGATDLTVTFHLPPGVQPDEPRYYPSPSGWPESQPQAAYDSEGRIIYRWHNAQANGYTEYRFGAGFPAAYVPAGAFVAAPILPSIRIDTEALTPLFCCAVFGALVVGWMGIAIASGNRRKLAYLPPKIAIEGHGIKRGLTAVEAAVLLETPLDRVLTMILFGVIKKSAARVVSEQPLKIEAISPTPEGLHDYELAYLPAIVKPESRERQADLQKVTIDIVKAVQAKMKGFSLRETRDYYRGIIEKAWQEVEQAGTPEVRSQRYDDSLEWTMLDRDFEGRTRRTFSSGPVFVPIWWGNYRPSYSGPRVAPVGRVAGAPASGGRVSLPHLPGSDFAASMVRGVQNTAAGLVTNVSTFTGGVTSKTNPPPPPPKVSSSRGGWSGGGGHSCACACACAGCACACAGGGR
jgi:hypothetical protein